VVSSLDEIEKMARGYRNACIAVGDAKSNFAQLAAFVLLALPVLRAAEAWDASRSDEKSITLCQALDAFRRSTP
jgi:hypothetical protein